MKGFTCTANVAAPRDHVFAVFTDFRRAAERVDGLESLVVLGDDPIGVGTKLRETRILYGRRAREEMTVTVFESPERYVLETTSHGAHFASEFSFFEEGPATRVSVTFSARPITLFAKLLAPLSRLMIGSVRRSVEQDIADLRQAAEA